MATAVKAQTANAFWEGLKQLPVMRQIGLLVGAAAGVALIAVVLLWAHEPSYGLLYGSLADKDASQVVEALREAGIPYKLDEGTGAVLVPASQVRDARLKLAAQGLPNSSGIGFELLDKEQGFGTSRFLETARYQRALAGELARTIMGLANVQEARVHLAIPKQSSFLRDREVPSASVMVKLFPGRALEDGQVAAIAHLVASSVPGLSTDRVTVVDQRGNLLTAKDQSRDMALTASQFEYTRRLEETYVKRIRDILAPIVGVDGVRAQVVADLDFTITEKTQEIFNPDMPAVRSEQTIEEQNRGMAAVGIPGALTNQPPGAGTTVPPGPQGTADAGPTSLSRSATRNYELDKTISHTRLASPVVRRLSVAVVVDDRQGVNEEGETVRMPLSEAELARITSLVKDAVGFSAQRGDSVNVINVSFQAPAELEPLPESPLWEQPWMKDMLKWLLGGMAVLLLLFGVLRPVLRSLAQSGAEHMQPQLAGLPGLEGLPEMAEDRVSLTGEKAGRLAAPDEYEEQLNMARQMAMQDPKRVAQVVKNWVASDG